MLIWPAAIADETPEASAARVFRWAFGLFDYSPDEVEWHIPEHWPLRSELEEHAAASGGRVRDDCDGFASLCRYALWGLGVPNRLVVCNVEPSAANPSPDGNHCVCTVEGLGLVLDNRQGRVVSREELERIGYAWCSLSGLKPGDDWTEVAGA